MDRLIAFDLETTGVDCFTDAPVSFAFVERRARDGAVDVVIDEGLVNPGRPIPRGASAVHGITDAMVADAPVLDSSIRIISERLASIWSSGGAILGMNVAYDLTMVDVLCRRLGLASLEEHGIGAVIDVLILDRHLDRWRRGPRKLTDLCVHYGVELSDAHSAAADAEASLCIYEAMLRDKPELAELAKERSNETQRGWYREWLTSFSSYLEKKGEAPIGTGRYAWPLHAEDRA